MTQLIGGSEATYPVKWPEINQGTLWPKLQGAVRRLLRQTAVVTTIKARTRTENGSQPDWAGERGVADSGRLLEASCVRNQNSQRVGRTEAVRSATGRNKARCRWFR